MASTRSHPMEEQLVREHLPLVHYAVNELAHRLPRHVARDDLVSAGMAGLAQAARSFDDARGVRFDRYAATRIRGALLDELRRSDWASRSVRSRARRVSETSERLTGLLGRSPSKSEVAEAMGCSVADVEAMAADVHRAVVLNFDSLTGGATADDVLPANEATPDMAVIENERTGYLVDAVATLPERLRRVIVGYYLDELAMAKLADELGVTESRISQMRTEALSLLRDGINSQLDPEDVVTPAHQSRRVSARKQAYHQAIARRSTMARRITSPSLASLA